MQAVNGGTHLATTHLGVLDKPQGAQAQSSATSLVLILLSKGEPEDNDGPQEWRTCLVCLGLRQSGELGNPTQTPTL